MAKKKKHHGYVPIMTGFGLHYPGSVYDTSRVKVDRLPCHDGGAKPMMPSGTAVNAGARPGMYSGPSN